MYFSVSHGQWVKATVTERRGEDGSVLIDTKGAWLTQDQQGQRLRPRAALEPTHGNVLNELVAAFGASSFFRCYAMEARVKAASVLDGCGTVKAFSDWWTRVLQESFHRFEAQEDGDVAADLRQHGSSVGAAVQAIITLATTPPDTFPQASTALIRERNALFSSGHEEPPLEAFSTADPSFAGVAVAGSPRPDTVEPLSNVCGEADVINTVASPTQLNLRDQQSQPGPLQDVPAGGSLPVPPVANAMA